jgi:hypothetical protein
VEADATEFSHGIPQALRLMNQELFNTGGNSLERVVKSRADLIAGVLVGRAGHSMSLEAQTVGREETTAQQKVIARRLLAEWPRDLWDASWDRRSRDGRAGGG